ncbi:MAG: iron-containing alcohol dehydrogenase [Actinomycetota bacterium]|nr:iron-containing alcohol dehydrogenase [Actinomycetota bacterium]
MTSNIFRFPVQVIFGEGCLKNIGTLAKGFGTHALLVTGGSATSRLGAVAELKGFLGDEGIEVTHFAEVEPDPSVETVESGTEFAAQNGCDFVIGLGGGSPMDAAKVMAARLNNEGDIASWEGVGKIPGRSKPLICIPTTSGTGSEATSVAVITGGKRRHKMPLVSQNLYPILAVIDPELTYGKSPELTAATGMDALTHAVESYVARKAWIPTRILSRESVRLVFTFLERACNDGGDQEARRQLSLASFMSGMAFTNAGLGLNHAIAHALGAQFGLSHGKANALLLPHVMRFNLESCPELYRELATAMGASVSGVPARRAAEQSVEAVEELVSSLPLPRNLSEAGIAANSVEKLAAEAFLDTRLRSSNPRDSVYEDVVEILRNAL